MRERKVLCVCIADDEMFLGKFLLISFPSKETGDY
jgi:hypothetical protein